MPQPRATAAAELDKLAALCGTLRLNCKTNDIAETLLDPIACALGADAAAYRQLRLQHARPQILNLTSIGVPASVADDYLEHYHRFDPFLDHMRLAAVGPPALIGPGIPVPDHPVNAFPVQAIDNLPRTGDSSSRSLYTYYHDFLYPNGLVHHTGFMITDSNRQYAWIFNFHRPGSAPDFSDLELARSRLVQACLQVQAEGPSTSEQNCLTALTEREQDVVMAVSRGLSNKEIATRLGISPRTVENHLRNIYEKLHVNTRTQLLSVLHPKPL